MAIINLGSIKFNWRGAYDGATSYTVDDVVSSGGNSYVCIAATTGNTPPNATYWELMAQAGTDGTDLTTTLTTQGDILYRDGSGLSRLGAGTAGQALITNGTGANPSWGDAGGGKVLQVVTSVETSSWNTLDTTFVTGGSGVTITPSDTSSKILIMASNIAEVSDGRGYYTIYRDSTNVNTRDATGDLVENQIYSGKNPFTMIFLDSPSSTSALTYKIAVRSHTYGQYTTTSKPVYIALEIGA